MGLCLSKEDNLICQECKQPIGAFAFVYEDFYYCKYSCYEKSRKLLQIIEYREYLMSKFNFFYFSILI